MAKKGKLPNRERGQENQSALRFLSPEVSEVAVTVTDPMPPPVSRWWTFTIFGVNGNPNPLVPEVILTDNGLTYYCFQLECCPKTGKLHYQGVVRFARPVGMSKVKDTLKAAEAHLEICRYPKASMAYCQKADSRVEGPWVGGNPGEQGPLESDDSEVEFLGELVRVD